MGEWRYREVSGQLRILAALPPKTEPGTPSMEGRVDPRADLEAVAKTENPFLAPAGNRTSAINEAV